MGSSGEAASLCYSALNPVNVYAENHEKSEMAQLDNVLLYEDDRLWDWDYLQNPYYRIKVGLVRGMIPQEVRTIFDVGCGNGAIINALNLPSCWVVGGDRSHTALRRVHGPVVRLSTDSLPFADHSFDLVMSHQVLEHLPDSVFRQTTLEILRVAKRYILVSIPYRERKKQSRAYCGQCRYKYNVWGHVRTFRYVSTVRRLFPTFVLRAHAFCGRENEYFDPLSRWTRQWIGGAWATLESAVCPRCGSREQYRATSFPRSNCDSSRRSAEPPYPQEKKFLVSYLFVRAL